MRIIKFRAWDKEKKKWRKIFLINPLGFPIINIKSEIMGQELPEIREDIIELVQSTGLKDKNGKEIFEGDIVIDEMNKISLIVWFEAGFVLNGKFEEVGTGIIDEYNNDIFYSEKYLEVIGNIYENSSLIDNPDTKV